VQPVLCDCHHIQNGSEVNRAPYPELWLGCFTRVASLTKGSRVLFPSATETLRADSRAVLCFPEDGRLKFEGWVVVIKE